MKRKISISFVLVLLAAFNLFGQIATKSVKSFDANYKIDFRNPAQDKNFYLLSLMQNQKKLRASLAKNRIFQEWAKEKNVLPSAVKCDNKDCFDAAFRFTGADIEYIAKVFENSANDKNLMNLVENDLRPSGMFILYAAKSNTEMLAMAWRDAANGLNHILDVYGLGKDALYKDIDNVSYDVNGAEYKQILKTKVAEIKPEKNALFFEPTLAYAMKLLEANGRDEAGRFEPMEQSENKAAFENLKNIKWNDFPYSVILVLGSGPNAKLGDAPNIGKIGIQRAEAAVKMFQEKKAPLLILSGGYVHPARTPYCEALEMKKYVMEKFKIPESAILIDPHARHTTTNVRNAARLMFRYKIPSDKKGLITSSQSHIDYVAGNEFVKRFMKELDLVPMQIFARVSPIEVEFLPLSDALFMNSMDPLDP
ncbi:MAG TPA: YdcF family protein [Pyrinomonadaceae bacterium]|nr:YdcF family protein [Pyrinomonadaceae bacterium]